MAGTSFEVLAILSERLDAVCSHAVFSWCVLDADNIKDL